MTQARITVTGDTFGLEGITLTDASLAAFVDETPEDERPQLVERALRIGLLTLCNAGVSMSADVVKAEFERLYERMEATQEDSQNTDDHAARALRRRRRPAPENARTVPRR